jgi:hypothetical protein
VNIGEKEGKRRECSRKIGVDGGRRHKKNVRKIEPIPLK